MNLNEVCELKVVSSSFRHDSAQQAVNEVNALFRQGWILIKVYTTNLVSDNYDEHQNIHYVLGVDGNRKAQLDIASGLIKSSP